MSAPLQLGSSPTLKRALELAAETLPDPPAQEEEWDFMTTVDGRWVQGRITLTYKPFNEVP